MHNSKVCVSLHQQTQTDMKNLDLTTLTRGTLVTSDFYSQYNTSYRYLKVGKKKVSLQLNSCNTTSTGRLMSVYNVSVEKFLKDFYLA